MKAGHPERWGIVHTSFRSVINRLIVRSFSSFKMTAQGNAE